MNVQSLLVEVLLSAFFALACFRARGQEMNMQGLAPRKLFVLKNRLDRLRYSRWQWFFMVLIVVLVRMQMGTPLVAEMTALAQFVLFMALPTNKSAKGALHCI
jgi:hypothetical protein